jgi:hypothetical protein
MKFNELQNFRSIISKIANQSLPFTTAYRINRLVHALEEAWSFYAESMTSLVQQYGQKNENGELVYSNNGEGIMLIPETAEEANIKMMELGEVEADLPDITFTPEEFSKLELSAWEVELLIPFIKE